MEDTKFEYGRDIWMKATEAVMARHGFDGEQAFSYIIGSAFSHLPKSCLDSILTSALTGKAGECDCDK